MSRSKAPENPLSRRAFLKTMGVAPVLLHPAPFCGLRFGFPTADIQPTGLALAEFRLQPDYPTRSPLENVLRRVAPGSDEYVTEKYAYEIERLLAGWAESLRSSPHDQSVLAKLLDPSITAFSVGGTESTIRKGGVIAVTRRQFATGVQTGRERFLREFRGYLGTNSRVQTAKFEIVGIEEITSEPLMVRADVRYDLVIADNVNSREERVGHWRTEWSRNTANGWSIRRWEGESETRAVTQEPGFIDVTAQALSAVESYKGQLLRGADYWRTVLDGACGIDVYGNNGIAAGDFDSDGFDDLYVCQPAGLPNRLYRNRGDGTFEDVTDKAGVGVLDNTACAIFADFENKGLQDLLVVCGSGPMLFINQGNGAFLLKKDAFRFASNPQGTFTHAAVADYDGDGRLDIYFCLYSYYRGLDQYHYPVPYFDARNGPPNFLLHNEGNATFVDRTETAGLNANNNRYSFACAWGATNSKGVPDLYVANDFGRSNLYRNNSDGTFTDVSTEAHVEDVGAGMSASWSDFDNDGRQDVYAANMWSAAGQRVSEQRIFHSGSPEDVRALYRRHARGNSLYRNLGDGRFQNITDQAGVEMGRWSWCSDFWDFDHDGYPDLYVANGYISGPDRSDLSSFFWRQVVGKSPDDATPTPAYEHGWNALNELIRSDSTWSGYERNVMYANNRDGSFSEVSGAIGLDFLEDSRSFALADIDHDGRLEVILKNRNAPQLRVLRNAMKDLGHSVAFRLRGRKSNRDAVGAAITLEAEGLRQTKHLQAGSGFLAQHSKEVFFGVGKDGGPLRAVIRWPSGSSQEFVKLPVDHRIEIEEGKPDFVAKPFSAPPVAYAQQGPAAAAEPLPSKIDTWLIEPLKAPEFSLPDLAGRTCELRSFRGNFVLLHFWAMKAMGSREQLTMLQQHRQALSGSRLQVIGINVDDPADAQEARSAAAQLALPYPVVFATAEIAGIYNIIYRYLFDRRRDLPVPASLLLDGFGKIVKLYQGPIDPRQLLDDIKEMPTSAAERLKKALPFDGVVYQDAFQRNDFTYGVAFFQHGYLDAAAESFQQVIAEKPNDAEAYYNLGTLNLRKNDLQQARQYLVQAVRLRPEYPEAWNNLGMIAAQQGQAEEAIRNFQECLRLRPNYAIALLNLGNLYRRGGAFDQAQGFLKQALEIEPDDPEANYSLGMLYAQQGQMQAAQDSLEKAIALRPDYAEALNNLGVLFVRSKNYPTAKEQFETCIRVAPSFDQCYMNLARVYVLQNDKDNARNVLTELLRLQPENRGAQQALEMLKSLP
jgi:tetratricopeptide (TPR) repeat protein